MHDTDEHVIAADIVGETHAFSYTTEQKETAAQKKSFLYMEHCAIKYACRKKISTVYIYKPATCAETPVIVWIHTIRASSPLCNTDSHEVWLRC